jgi:hypothetical protein
MPVSSSFIRSGVCKLRNTMIPRRRGGVKVFADCFFTLSQFSQRLNPMDGVEHPRSRAPHAATEMNFGLREKYAEIYFGRSAVLTETEHAAGGGRLVRRGSPRQRLNPMDGVEHSRSRAPHAATEMNFGLREKYAEIYFGRSAVLTETEHAAGGGRLVRRGSPRQGLNPMDGVEHSRSRAPHAATEMNFGLREKYAEIYSSSHRG